MFHVHRSVLSQVSPVWNRMLNGDFAEATSSIVFEEDSPGALSYVLESIYFAEECLNALCESDSTVVALLDKYQLNGVRTFMAMIKANKAEVDRLQQAMTAANTAEVGRLQQAMIKANKAEVYCLQQVNEVYKLITENNAENDRLQREYTEYKQEVYGIKINSISLQAGKSNLQVENDRMQEENDLLKQQNITLMNKLHSYQFLFDRQNIRQLAAHVMNDRLQLCETCGNKVEAMVSGVDFCPQIQGDIARVWR